MAVEVLAVPVSIVVGLAEAVRPFLGVRGRIQYGVGVPFRVVKNVQDERQDNDRQRLGLVGDHLVWSSVNTPYSCEQGSGGIDVSSTTQRPPTP